MCNVKVFLTQHFIAQGYRLVAQRLFSKVTLQHYNFIKKQTNLSCHNIVLQHCGNVRCNINTITHWHYYTKYILFAPWNMTMLFSEGNLELFSLH